MEYRVKNKDTIQAEGAFQEHEVGNIQGPGKDQGKLVFTRMKIFWARCLVDGVSTNSQWALTNGSCNIHMVCASAVLQSCPDTFYTYSSASPNIKHDLLDWGCMNWTCRNARLTLNQNCYPRIVSCVQSICFFPRNAKTTAPPVNGISWEETVR